MRLTKQRKEELFKQGLKQCPHCTEPKLLNKFHKDNRATDGHNCCCKEHISELLDNPNRKQKIKDWCLKNKTKIKKRLSEYYIKNKGKMAKQQKENYLKNKDKRLEYQKEYRDNNREKILKKGKIFRDKLENKIKKAKQDREYNNNRRKTDINFKILCNLRTRIHHALSGNNKSLSTMFLIGCEIDYLMYYIQEKFTKGMSWDNYGLWQIDHIKPCVLFDLSKELEQKACFCYTNLQPLWAEDNKIKSDKYNNI